MCKAFRRHPMFRQSAHTIAAAGQRQFLFETMKHRPVSEAFPFPSRTPEEFEAYCEELKIYHFLRGARIKAFFTEIPFAVVDEEGFWKVEKQKVRVYRIWLRSFSSR